MIGSFVEFKQHDSSNTYQGIILDKFKDISYNVEAKFNVIDYYLIRLNNKETLFKIRPSEITKILNYVR